MPTKRSVLLDRKIPALLAVLALLAIGVFLLELAGVTHFFHRKTAVITSGQSVTSTGSGQSITKGQPSSNDNSNNSPESQPGDSKNGTSGQTSSTLLVPSGDFVSAHNVQLDTPIASVCNTTPGATCIISFTSGSLIRSLTAETADRGGSAYWNSWTPRSMGLTVGSWQVQATATLNGQTKTAVDANMLVVSS